MSASTSTLFEIRIQSERIALDSLDDAIEQEQCGAVVRFIGRVRNDARNSAMTHLELEHFPGVTEQEIQRIITQARERWRLQRVQVIHRVGPIAIGESIVLVETASAHRKDAYEANTFIMDYLKTQAPFWKKEHFADDSTVWVEAKPSDQQAEKRWTTGTATQANRRIGAIILAGGEGRRMGYRNKGLQPFRGKPLVQHTVQILRPQVAYLGISANQDLEAYKQLGFPVFSDAPALQGKGPLAGLFSAIPHIPPNLDAILIAPCDTPLLPANLVSSLSEKLFAGDATSNSSPAAVIATTEDGPQPILALFRPALLLGLMSHLQQPSLTKKELSLLHWLERTGYDTVHFDNADAFANINDLATLDQLQTS